MSPFMIVGEEMLDEMFEISESDIVNSDLRMSWIKLCLEMTDDSILEFWRINSFDSKSENR